MTASNRLKIGISACFFHADPARPIFTGKTLQYIEQSVAHWAMSEGDLAVMIPSPEGLTRRGDATLADYAGWLDALLLMGGADLWPGSYGEEPLQPQWSGDRLRDEYEIALARAFVAAGKPVLGVCRGMQLLNVAFGGSLYQDIATQQPGALRHRDAALYDQNFHTIAFAPGSCLAGLYAGRAGATVNSVHHQAVKRLAPGFAVEAVAPEDGTIEAMRWQGPGYVAAVQWHPEFHTPGDARTLDDGPLLRHFLAAARNPNADLPP